LIDAVELCGVYVASMTGNIDLTPDAGIAAARTLGYEKNHILREAPRIAAGCETIDDRGIVSPQSDAY
jgi:hypothetical protein